jgi:hypothetical protein
MPHIYVIRYFVLILNISSLNHTLWIWCEIIAEMASIFRAELNWTSLFVIVEWIASVSLFLFIYSYNSNHFVLEPLNLVDDSNDAEVEVPNIE